MTTTFKDYLINKCDDYELAELYREFVDNDLYYANSAGELVEELGFTASEAVRRMYYGKVESLTEYAYVNAYGNIETTYDLTTLLDMDELVNALVNEEHTLYENWLTSDDFCTDFETWLTTEKADEWGVLKDDYTVDALIDNEHDIFNEFVESNLI